MINYIELLDAVNIVNGHREWEGENQLATSLFLYKERREFDGTIESAKECLTLAGYEIA